ncbi:alpha-hydroxy-acid oxidizing protein [Streptomyces silvisoli]|uniref:Alpha-hydroxy-acid oxidizing protein n=1 Tax=Streptomyces silvisoli TaxID=3034235 RepID=A0ABT5ZDC4_9ACTN|nr:alpha-hydroxy-acid oxidizing protein [Streptomyces silvisoli]MDF3287821.1 alpha-hydroxy-acid oxidizing protein [Streptomyces silvisoli]
MPSRRLPTWSALRPLLRPRPLPLDPTGRRLSRAHTIADLRAAARRRTPRAVFDFADGAAEREISLRRTRRSFDRVEFHPGVLREAPRPSALADPYLSWLAPARRNGDDFGWAAAAGPHRTG